MKKESESTKALINLVKTAAAEAANYQQRYAAEDTEARRIVEVMETYLRQTGRIVYGGAAINAQLKPQHRFYDPALYLPDYDFMTPDPLQDTADLITAFQHEGFQEVEAKLGIHEGTYKIFVNFRAAADITYMPPLLYQDTLRESSVIDGIRYASPDFLRMNIYVELSRPAGNVERWAKVYERLLLLNQDHPIKTGRCPKVHTEFHTDSAKLTLTAKIEAVAEKAGAIFLSPANQTPILLMLDTQDPLNVALVDLGLIKKTHEALGELLPARTEFHKPSGKLVAVVFNTVACHAYVLDRQKRIASLDLMIHMYYAMHFARLDNYYPMRAMCLIQNLVERQYRLYKEALRTGAPIMSKLCLGYQPQMPELKRAHRKRVLEKREEIQRIMVRRTQKKSKS
jgi:hypothetical protein